MRFPLIVALVAIVAASCATPNSSGSTAEPTVTYPSSGGVYKLVSRSSGLVMTLKDAASSDGTEVLQESYVDSGAQQWRVTTLANGQFKFVSVLDGTKSFDLAGGGTASGASLQIWGYYGATNQRYTLAAADTGYFRITPVSAPRYCLQVSGNSTAPGAGIKMSTYTGTFSQQWSFVPVTEAPPVPPPVANGVYQIINRSSGMAMAPMTGGSGSGTPIRQTTKTAADDQFWSLTNLGNGQYKIQTALGAKALEVPGSTMSTGDGTDLGDYSGGSHQRFIITVTDQGWFRISPASAPGLSLGVVDSTESPVQLMDPADPRAQWKFTTYVPVVDPNGSANKNRVIVLTDIGSDPDDTESMVRAMLYSNEIDFEGLIHSTSCWWPTASQAGIDKITRIVSAYGRVRPNLIVHDSAYPSAAYLMSLVKLGQTTYGMAGVGAGHDTDGSNLIVAAVDRDDPRPVWISVWGGVSTLAQALWRVQHDRTPEQVAAFVSKIRVYDIAAQDDAGAWISHTFPSLVYLCSVGQFYGMGTQGDTSFCDAAWLASHVQNKGDLGAEYPSVAWTMEGDTPSFLYLMPNGLHDPMVFDQGGWGGRFNTSRTLNPRSTQNSGAVATSQTVYDNYLMYTEASDDGNPQKPVFRWRAGYQNDLSARMDWSLAATYSGANHHPIAQVDNDATKAILERTVAAGTSVSLDGTGSSDPDGNNLVYSWWFYNEPSTYDGSVTIQGASTAKPTIAIPNDAAGKTIHIILELRDDAPESLYAYRRVIFHVQ